MNSPSAYLRNRIFEITLATLIMIFLFGYTVISTRAQANVPPSAGTPVVFSSGSASNPDALILNEGARITAYIEGTATDENGCIDIDSPTQYEFKFYRTTFAGEEGIGCSSTDGVNCYAPDLGSLILGTCSESTTTITYSMPFEVNYFTEPTEDLSGVTHSNTDWRARVYVEDDAAQSAVAYDTVEINALRALNVTSSIDYGTVIVGGTSASAEVIVINTGNSPIDYSVGYNQDMQCEVNSFPGRSALITQNGSMLSYSATPMTSVQSPTLVNASIPVATAMSISSTDSLYGYMMIPEAAGVRGACSNTAAYTATADGSDGI